MMCKFKKNRFLLLLLLFVFSGQSVWGISNDLPVWSDSHLTVRVKTGQGKVYAATYQETSPNTNQCIYTEFTKALTNTKNGNYRPCPFKILAVPSPGYEFDYWECVQNTGDYDTDKANKVGDKLYLSDSENQAGSIWNVKAAYSKRVGATSSVSGTESNVINAIWEVHFKEIITKYVDVVSENTSFGTASIDKGNNNLGDEVNLTASCNSTNVKFVGWYRENPSTGEKEFVTRDNPLTMTITNDNKGTYYARFDNGYYFWRIKNYDTKHYISSVAKYTGAAIATNLQDALNTQLTTNDDLPSSIVDAGTMMQVYISGHQSQTDKEIWDIFVQNDHTNQFYDVTPGSGVFLQVTHQADNTYLIQGNGDKFYVIEGNNHSLSASFDFGNIRPYGKWNLEGMDKDVTTKENYFAVAPNEFVGPDAEGNYWTTLRVCFNMKYATDEITPYIITSVDEDQGTLELTEVTGGIIPATKCVLLKCKSTDVTRNVMVPTRDNASFNTDGNLLISSKYYYPNQKVSEDILLQGKSIKKAIIKDGNLAFGGDALTYVDGNRCYLELNDEVSKIPNVTLAELLASGDTQRTYNITDLRAVEYVDQDRMLICKDNNGYATKDEKSNEEYIDFMHTATLTNGITSTIPATYDQSNWIGLRLSDGATLSYLLKTHQLKDVVGKLTNTVNPEFLLEQVPEANGESEPYTRNVYIAASFSGSNNQESPVNHNVYFFVQPKPMEIANIEWAQWNGEKFVAPVANAANPTWNQAQLSGEFEFNGSYLEQGGVFLETGHCYEMLPALIRFKEGNYDHVYVLGNVNGIGWDPHKGVEMYTSNGNIYTANVTVNASDGEYGFFSFTKKLGEWDDIKGYRFGAVADGANYYVDPNYLGTELPLAFWSSDSRSFQLAQGAYRLTVNLSTMKLVITPAQYGAPSLRDGNQFVVYPTTINKVTTEENGVITAINNMQAGKAVTRVVYYNLMGVESDVPHPGINIVEKRYSDGSRSVEKVMK